ncbi:hypothetical protein GCM10010278_66610 [Streptomyces melanogenes]|nr:hypothetical protein GCM10010278_66610 [Streptomyces melanogenes]
MWGVVEPLLPKVEWRARHPGRKQHPDRLVFQRILFVLHTGIGWEHLPQELGFGSGMTCWTIVLLVLTVLPDAVCHLASVCQDPCAPG